MGRALREVKGERVEAARNGSGFESQSGFRDAFEKIFGEPPTAAKTTRRLFAERIETPLGSMLAIADDAGLRLLEFVDRRALNASSPILRTRLKTNVVPGEHRHLTAVRETARRLFFGKKLEFHRPPRARRFALSTARLEIAANHSVRRNPFLLLDGGTTRRQGNAPRRRPGQRRKHALHHHPMSSSHPR